ncbi:hypothetical protein [Rhodococcus sp. LW-XY12]|uniref:hypothetical protein n=1 Tax=Rhodococcus sp. LW-XY12 TaxID=2856851 RepID=UPI001C572055|nr:hypothetical protein [Rhodococcus sp. LW-XY12]QXU56639.1 hypothetical protein KXC42_25755 [Rhodococcus sp. LW-XY12]
MADEDINQGMFGIAFGVFGTRMRRAVAGSVKKASAAWRLLTATVIWSSVLTPT